MVQRDCVRVVCTNACVCVCEMDSQGLGCKALSWDQEERVSTLFVDLGRICASHGPGASGKGGGTISFYLCLSNQDVENVPASLRSETQEKRD